MFMEFSLTAVSGMVFYLVETVIVLIQLEFHHTDQVYKDQNIFQKYHITLLFACHKPLVQRTFQLCDLRFCTCLSKTQKACKLGTLMFDLHTCHCLKMYISTHYILHFFLGTNAIKREFFLFTFKINYLMNGHFSGKRHRQFRVWSNNRKQIKKCRVKNKKVYLLGPHHVLMYIILWLVFTNYFRSWVLVTTHLQKWYRQLLLHAQQYIAWTISKVFQRWGGCPIPAVFKAGLDGALSNLI